MGKIADTIKSGAKKTWEWVKAHPGETCLIVGSAIIGGVTGSKLGHKKGYGKGWRDGMDGSFARITGMPLNMVRDGYSAYMTDVRGDTLETIIADMKDDDRIPDDATFTGILTLDGSFLSPEERKKLNKK